MTVVALFDVLEHHEAVESAAPGPELAEVAGAMVRAAREDYQRLRRYEQDFASFSDDDDVAELDLLRCIWRLFDNWAEQAEQLLARVDRLEKTGGRVAVAEGLRDDYGFTRARLSITPEQIVRAKQQVWRGEAIPMKELRDELRARLRA